MFPLCLAPSTSQPDSSHVIPKHCKPSQGQEPPVTRFAFLDIDMLQITSISFLCFFLMTSTPRVTKTLRIHSLLCRRRLLGRFSSDNAAGAFLFLSPSRVTIPGRRAHYPPPPSPLCQTMVAPVSAEAERARVGQAEQAGAVRISSQGRNCAGSPSSPSLPPGSGTHS